MYMVIELYRMEIWNKPDALRVKSLIEYIRYRVGIVLVVRYGLKLEHGGYTIITYTFQQVNYNCLKLISFYDY